MHVLGSRNQHDLYEKYYISPETRRSLERRYGTVYSKFVQGNYCSPYDDVPWTQITLLGKLVEVRTRPFNCILSLERVRSLGWKPTMCCSKQCIVPGLPSRSDFPRRTDLHLHTPPHGILVRYQQGQKNGTVNSKPT